MSDAGGTATVLPYRTGADELLRWVEAHARGRSPAQIRELGFSEKTLEGTVLAAEALGFYARERDELTGAGRRLALASEAERKRLLREAVLAYAPYARLLEAIAASGERSPTEAEWIETWWATQGYGSSPSNRAEAAQVLGRFAEGLGLGRYIPGRRGHSTRIEWTGRLRAAAGGAEAPGAEGGEGGAAGSPVRVPAAAASARPAEEVAAAGRDGAGGYNRVRVPLSNGGVAELVVPLRLPATEKRRLLALLELLISDDGSGHGSAG